MEKRKKRAQAGIIVIILLVAIAIVAVLIVWNVVRPLLEKKGEEAEALKTALTINLDVKEVLVFVTGPVWVTIGRKAGGGEITGLKFAFYDEKGESYIDEKETQLEELESETYHFSPRGIGKIKSVKVVPVFEEKLGREFGGDASKVLELPIGLVSWWRFDEDASDFVGNNHGGSMSIIEDNERGKVASFSGNPLNVMDNPSLSIDDEIAISFWIKTSDENGEIIKKGDNYGVLINEGLVKFSFGDSIISDDSIDLLDGDWHHVVATMMGIYIDTEWVSEAMTGSANTNSDIVVIGNFNGYIDELMLFNKSLAGTGEGNQVKGLFDNQKGNFQ